MIVRLSSLQIIAYPHAGEIAVNIRELVGTLNISIGTVSRAINGGEDVRTPENTF